MSNECGRSKVLVLIVCSNCSLKSIKIMMILHQHSNIIMLSLAIFKILQLLCCFIQCTGPEKLVLLVGTNVCNTLNLEAVKPVMTGYLWKLGGSSVFSNWRKRWFVLKHDNVLYYYKTKEVSIVIGILCWGRDYIQMYRSRGYNVENKRWKFSCGCQNMVW